MRPPGPSPRVHRGTTAVVTGASSGLGSQFVKEFARRGADVVLVARRRGRMEELASEVRTNHGVDAHVLEADLGSDEGVDDLVAALADQGLRVDSLVNCAGFATAASFEDTEPERLEQLVAVNVVALTMLTKALLPQLLESGRGVLVNIASTAAYQLTPGMAAYGASKAYVLSLTEAIAEETRCSGLRVLALSPGPTRTEFFDVAGGENVAVGAFQTPQQVIATAFEALDHEQPRSVVSGWRNKVTAKLVGIMPRRLVLAAARKSME